MMISDNSETFTYTVNGDAVLPEQAFEAVREFHGPEGFHHSFRGVLSPHKHPSVVRQNTRISERWSFEKEEWVLIAGEVKKKNHDEKLKDKFLGKSDN